MPNDYDSESFSVVNGYTIKYGTGWNGGYYEIWDGRNLLTEQTGYSGSEKARISAEKWIGDYSKEKKNV